MEKYGFIYMWYDKKRKMYYIGCHYGREDDGYICSSNRMRDAYRRRPQDFKRRILKRNIERNQLLTEEYNWLKLISKEELGKKYYNINNRHFGHWSNNPDKLLLMKEMNTGRNNPMFGKPSVMKGKNLSEETKQKIRIARSKQIITEETKQKISESHKGDKNPFYGKKHTEETKQKMRKPKKISYPMSEETKKKLSEIAKKRCSTPEGRLQLEKMRR